jgi:transcriptional regulator with XRE-family HTH domain
LFTIPRIVAVMDDPELPRRRGFWMRMAREHAGLSQATAANELGLSGRSKSTLSAWEAGTREPKLSYVAKMAGLYGVPVELLTSPPPTAYEVIDRRLALAIADAEALEREDWVKAEAPGPAADGAPGGGLRRRSA